MVGRKLVLWIAAVGALGVTLRWVGGQGIVNFRPPRTAVVDISEVFEAYQKKKDRQAEFESEIQGVQTKLSELEKQYKELLEELPNLGPGERRNELELKKFVLEQDVKKLRQNETERLRKTQVQYLKEIRDEITAEIQAYAEAEDLDLVLESTVVGDLGPEVGQFRWPIVHHVKPELEISSAIAKRLNARYRPK